MSVRYLATRMLGDGTEALLRPELPIMGGSVTSVLTGYNGLTGSISPETLWLVGADGRPLLEPWSTAIYAEVGGVLVGGGILADLDTTGPELGIDCIGLTGYPAGMPYIGEQSWPQVDPLHVLHHIWRHIQTQPAGDVGLEVPVVKSPVA